MKDLITWLNTIPASVGIFLSFFSALIVAVISRLGVTSQIRHENDRFDRKLQHEAKEKAVERAMQMKREVFMTVCEGLSFGSQFLSKFADQNITSEKHQQLLTDIGPRIYRVHIIANDLTISALVNAYDFFVESVFKLESLRFAINLRRADLNQIEMNLKQHQQNEQTIYEKLGEAQQINTNIGLQNFFNEQLRATQAAVTDLKKKAADLNNQILHAQMNLASNAIHAAMDFENCSTRAVLAMRTELEFPINSEQYETMMRSAREKMKAGVNTFIADILNAIGNPAPSRLQGKGEYIPK